MNDPVDALIVDLLEWIGPAPRPCADVLEAWRTSCPRLPVWEEANARGYVDRVTVPGEGAHVVVSARGKAHLRAALARRGAPGTDDQSNSTAGGPDDAPRLKRGGRASTPRSGPAQRGRAERTASNA